VPESESEVLNFLTLESSRSLESHKKKQELRIPARRTFISGFN